MNALHSSGSKYMLAGGESEPLLGFVMKKPESIICDMRLPSLGDIMKHRSSDLALSSFSSDFIFVELMRNFNMTHQQSMPELSRKKSEKCQSPLIINAREGLTTGITAIVLLLRTQPLTGSIRECCSPAITRRTERHYVFPPFGSVVLGVHYGEAFSFGEA